MAITESRIKTIEDRLDEITQNYIQAQENQVSVTAKVDENNSKAIVLDNKIDKATEIMFPEWNPDGYDYYVSERVKYKGKLYRCIQNHKSQSDWAPGVAVSLWVEMSDPAEEWPEWKQPTGGHDAYAKGDKVSHNDKHWISDIDANVWEPGVSGWTEV